jgi:hypothetical protein
MQLLMESPNFWSAISAIGGAVSAIAALATVIQARKTATEARQAGHPYFTLEAPGLRSLPSSPVFRLILPLKNVGSRLAVSIEGRVFITAKTGNHDAILDHRFSIANTIPPNVPTPWYNDSVNLPTECPAHYVLLGIEYVDPGTGLRHRQAFYMRWDGVQSGITQPDFVHVNEHERSDIKARFASVIHAYDSGA